MKTIDITTTIIESNYDELTPDQQQLITQARNATQRSYAPYSQFSVGAAILLSNGTTITGTNQENAAYPSGLCAERTTAYYAHSTHPDAHFLAIAIAARGTDGNELPDPIAPCGACRQALLEYETLAHTDIQLLLAGKNRILIFPSIRSTLPYSFSEF